MEVSSEGGQVIQNVSKRFKNFCELVDKVIYQYVIIYKIIHVVITYDVKAHLWNWVV
jgi:hypothetical protein